MFWKLCLAWLTTVAVSRVAHSDSTLCSTILETSSTQGWCGWEDTNVKLHHVRIPLMMCLSGLTIARTPDVIFRHCVRGLRMTAVHFLMLGFMCWLGDRIWRVNPAFAYVLVLHYTTWMLTLSPFNPAIGVYMDRTIRYTSVLSVLAYAWLYGPPVPLYDIFCYTKIGHCGSFSHLMGVLCPFSTVEDTLQTVVRLLCPTRQGDMRERCVEQI